jgi:hypothetical protein
VIVTFADETDARANIYQQPKRLCTLDDIASPVGGMSLDVIAVDPNSIRFPHVQVLMVAGYMRACVRMQQQQVLTICSYRQLSVTLCQGVRFAEPRTTI